MTLRETAKLAPKENFDEDFLIPPKPFPSALKGFNYHLERTKIALRRSLRAGRKNALAFNIQRGYKDFNT